MRGLILEKMSDDETAVLEGQCFWISRQHFVDHVTEVEYMNSWITLYSLKYENYKIKISLRLRILSFYEGISGPNVVFTGKVFLPYLPLPAHIRSSDRYSTIKTPNVGADNANKSHKQPESYRIPGILLVPVPVFFSFQWNLDVTKHILCELCFCTFS